MKKILTVISAGVLLMYPFAVYYGLEYLSLKQLAMALLLIISLRLWLVRKSLKKMPWLLPASALGALMVSLTLFSNSPLGFKLYPLAVNFCMLCVFAFSYLKPPSVIESFARLKEPFLNIQGVAYTAKVTLVWCGFFTINGSVSLYTALFASLDTWMLYNGLISYLLMGVLMAIEYLIRLKVKARHLSADQNQDLSQQPLTELNKEHE